MTNLIFIVNYNGFKMKITTIEYERELSEVEKKIWPRAKDGILVIEEKIFEYV